MLHYTLYEVESDKIFELFNNEIRIFREEMRLLNKELTDTRVELAKLKTHAQVAGGLAGLFPAIVAIFISIFYHKK